MTRLSIHCNYAVFNLHYSRTLSRQQLSLRRTAKHQLSWRLRHLTAQLVCSYITTYSVATDHANLNIHKS